MINAPINVNPGGGGASYEEGEMESFQLHFVYV